MAPGLLHVTPPAPGKGTASPSDDAGGKCRATEAHFLDLLNKHLKPGVTMCIVAHSADAEGIWTRIHQALVSTPPDSTVQKAFQFTDFMRSRADQILAT